MNATANNSVTHVVEVTDIHENTSQEIIRITVDRLKLVLVEHKNGFERRKEWHTPLGLLLTIVLAFITSTFKDALGFKADTWCAFFLIGLLLSFAWLGRAVYIASKCPSMDDIVDKMKKSG
ncbi:MAG: hypothetical protein WCT30_02530 [Desulfurivibrionaceae bacterium]|jgi:hypothetical protein